MSLQLDPGNISASPLGRCEEQTGKLAPGYPRTHPRSFPPLLILLPILFGSPSPEYDYTPGPARLHSQITDTEEEGSISTDTEVGLFRQRSKEKSEKLSRMIILGHSTVA